MKIIAVLLLATTFACSDKHNERTFHPDSKPEVAAPQMVSDSFVVRNPKDANGAALIGIKKAGLDKEFLLQASLISQVEIPQFSGIKSRIVAFKRYGSKIYMMEATQGHQISVDLPQNFILASFDITEENGDEIFFDFNAGMSKIFVHGEWQASDFDGSGYQQSWDTVAIDESFIETAKVNDKNQLVVRQIAQIVSTAADAPNRDHVEVKYYLEPYRPTVGFEPTLAANHERMGFFEIAPLLTDEGTVSFATKFDISKPIVFAVSANTPKEYVQAVKDGIVYWNKAFGKEVLKAVEAPEGVTGPDFDYNVIQWVNWKDAGFAYADAQADPRTGEIKHAQIYMTSAFAFGGKAAARRALRALKAAPTSKLVGYSLAGLEPESGMNDYEFNQALMNNLDELLSQNPSDELVQRISNVYVAATIAHEVGHTLGLRHNFAGSLGSNISPLERTKIANDYYATGKVAEGIIPTSSVMEYSSFVDTIFTGEMASNSESSAFAYDQKVIEALYLGKVAPASEMPLFCTDSHRDLYVDCTTFDTGASPLVDLSMQTDRYIDNMAGYFIEDYIGAKTAARPTDLRTATPSEEILAEPVLSRVKLFAALKKEAQVLRVRRSYEVINNANIDEVLQAERDYIAEQFEAAGGLDKVFGRIDEKLAKVAPRFAELINSDVYRSGVGANDKPYEFTQAEIEMLVSEIESVMNKAAQATTKAEVASLLEVIPVLTDDELSYELLPTLKDIARDILLTHKGTISVALPNKDGVMTQLDLPVYSYPLEMRAGIAALLTTPSNSAWGYRERLEIKNMLEAHYAEVLRGVELDPADPTLPNAAVKWALERASIRL
jgi:hypothetical protein